MSTTKGTKATKVVKGDMYSLYAPCSQLTASSRKNSLEEYWVKLFSFVTFVPFVVKNDASQSLLVKRLDPVRKALHNPGTFYFQRWRDQIILHRPGLQGRNDMANLGITGKFVELLLQPR